MNLYITSGTADFMESVAAKHAKEGMLVLHGQSNTVLLHESERKSVFATPRRFEVVDGFGSFEQRGYYVFHNITLTDEARPVFEQKWLDQSAAIKQDSSLIAYRFLRPIKADSYIILTQWAGPASYEVWTKTPLYEQAIAPLFSNKGPAINNMFNAASHITTYVAAENEA